MRVFDLDQIADRIREVADYDGLARLLAEDFTPAVLVGPAEGSQAGRVAEAGPKSVAAQRPTTRKRTLAKQPRRSAAETIALVEQIKAEVPELAQAELALRIGMSPMRLRAVLATVQ